jgi:hypothetical protein
MKGGCARRSTPGFVFYGQFFGGILQPRAAQVLRKEDASKQIEAPEGIGDKVL